MLPWGSLSLADNATTTRYTQWDRLTLDTRTLGEVSYSPLAILASSSAPLASTTQMGTGNILALSSNFGEIFTVTRSSVGVATSSPQYGFSVGTTTLLTGTTTATNGFNITSGCYAVNGTCLSTGGGSAAGGTGAVQFANGTAFAGDATNFFWDNTNKRLGIGTSSPYAKLSIHGRADAPDPTAPLFVVATSSGMGTSTIFQIAASGALSVSSSATSTFANGIQLLGGCFRDTHATSTCIGRGQSATYVVAASNSINKDYADFVATAGNHAEQAINAAIQAAYSASRGTGGKVYLLEGDYIVGTSTADNRAIVMATGTELVGSGFGTRIILASSTPGNADIISASNMHHVVIRNLYIDGNSPRQTTGTQNGIVFNKVSTSTIENIIASSTRIYGIYLYSSSNNIVTGNTANSNTNHGIYLYSSSNNNTIRANTANGNIQYGIFLNSSSYNTITGNTANSNGSQGISLSDSSNNTITGNTANSNGSQGISLLVSSNNTITGNTVNGNGFYGIFLYFSSNNNTITGNTLYNNSSSALYASSIEVDGSTGNLISSNHITDTAGTGYAIRLANGSPTGNILVGNFYSGTGASAIGDFAATSTNPTRYTQWDRMTLDTKTLGQVSYSPLYVFASSTASSTAEIAQLGTGDILSLYSATSGKAFTFTTDARLGIGTSSPGSALAVQGVANFTTATSTFYSTGGINLTNGGCFAIGGTCLLSGTGPSAGALGTVQFANGSGGLSGDATNFFWDNTNKRLGIGTSSPYSKLSVHGRADSPSPLDPLFVVATSSGMGTSTIFSIAATGAISVNSSATTTFTNGIELQGGCFRNAQGQCVGGGKEATYIVAASNSIGKAYADFVATSSAQSAINRAISAAYSASRGAGGKVYLLEGDYIVTGTTTMATGTMLIGSGPGTVLTLASSTNQVLDLIVAQNIQHITIADLTIDGNRANQSSGSNSGVWFDYVGTSTIERVTVRNVLGDGIVSSGAFMDLNLRIDGVRVENTTFSGIAFSGSGLSHFTITNSTFQDIGSNGIYFPTGYYSVISHNHFIGIDGSAIFSNGGIWSTSITENVMENIGIASGSCGIASDFNYSNIANNLIDNIGGCGVSLGVSANNTVTNNIISNFAQSATNNNGISMGSGSSGNIISGNRIENGGTGYAINIASGVQDTVIANNSYSGPGANTINDAGTRTKYTQWDRLTLDTRTLGQVAYSPFAVIASSTQPLATTTQMGTGNIMALSSNFGEIFTVTRSSVGVATSNPQFGFAVGTTTLLTGTTTATNGFNITSGCYAVNGTCLSTGGSGSAAGGTGAVQFANGTAFAGDATNFFWDNTNKRLGIGSSTPGVSLAVGGILAASEFRATSTASSTFVNAVFGDMASTTNLTVSNALRVNGATSTFAGGALFATAGGQVAIATTTPSSQARLLLDNTLSTSGSTNAVAGLHGIYTMNPSAGGTQVGNRFVMLNNPTGATPNTSVLSLYRAADNSTLSNVVRGIEVNVAGGNNTLGVNTGIRTTGHTFGIQALSTGLAGGTSTAAAIYGEVTAASSTNILRLYTSTMTASSTALIYHDTTAFTGTGLEMNFGNGGGSFTGNFLDLRVNSNSRFTVSAAGTTTIGQPSQTSVAAGLQIGYGGLCVDNDGACVASTTGRISAREYTTGATDLAENYYSEDVLEPGDIVAPTGMFTVARAASTSRAVLGIVSTRPGIILGEGEKPQMDIPSYPIALSGRVPLKVSTLQGNIQVGDRIVLSTTTPGVGVAEATSTERGRPVVGIALEAFDGSFYRSQGVRDTETQEVATGTPVCTTEHVVHSSKNGGGFDLDGGSGSEYDTSSVDQVTTCTQERVTVVPDAGDALATTTPDGREMRIGKILVFVVNGQSLGTRSEGIAWEDDGEHLGFFRALDLYGNNIFNVGRIAAANGAWSIEADGTIRAERVIAKDVAAERSLEIGTSAMPTGVTIYDTTTGDPYCLRVSMGAVQAVPGTCSGSTSGFGGGTSGAAGENGTTGDTSGGGTSGDPTTAGGESSGAGDIPPDGGSGNSGEPPASEPPASEPPPQVEPPAEPPPSSVAP